MRKLFLLLLTSVLILLWLCSPTAFADEIPYDMGVPYLYGKQYTGNDMNMDVYWVQVQMKATGCWYQGETWDCTGNLGDHTMREISSFMRSRGYFGHTGYVDQNVINELADYLGDNIQPVCVGGFYNAMDAIMTGGSAGSMKQIVSNLRDMVSLETIGARWVQICLKYLGYYGSVVDGKYGESTELAVKEFQRVYGFEERDYVSLGVARAMIEAYYYAGGDLNNLPGSNRFGSKTRPTAIPSQFQSHHSSPWGLAYCGVNRSESSIFFNEPALKVEDTVYFHARLTGGSVNEKVNLHYRIYMNGELMDENDFSGQFSSDSYVWVRYTPFRYGTLAIEIGYIDNNTGFYRELGTTSVYINPRTDETITETAKGWISGYDLYINRYDRLCFDLTSFMDPSDGIICFIRDDTGLHQGTIVGGYIYTDSPVANSIYEYAFWHGPHAYSRDVAALSVNQIPSSAWTKLYVTEEKQIVIVSTSIAIRIKETE